MSQVTIDLAEDDAAQLAERARERHSTPVEQLAAEAVRTYLHPEQRLGFVLLGASGIHDTAARAEEILRAELPASSLSTPASCTPRPTPMTTTTKHVSSFCLNEQACSSSPAGHRRGLLPDRESPRCWR